MSQLESEIRVVAAQDLSCVSDADCTSTGVGRALCGGPTFLVTNSLRSVDHQNLTSLIAEYNQAENDFNAASPGNFGACVYLQPGPVACVNHACVAGPTFQ